MRLSLSRPHHLRRPGHEPSVEAASAADWGPAYRARIAAQRDAVVHAALRTGQTPLFHRTDHPPAHALAALYQAFLRQ